MTKSFSNDLLREILAIALEDNSNPFQLLCCRRFRDICYEIGPGLPFRYPTDVKVHANHYYYSKIDCTPNKDRDQLVRRILADDFGFVKDAMEKAPSFVLSGLYFYHGKQERRNVLFELVELKKVAMFQLLLGGLRIEILNNHYLLWELVEAAVYGGEISPTHYWNTPISNVTTNKQTSFWNDFARPAILHNVKHGFYIERANCVGGGCVGSAPGRHRGLTLKAIFKFDDVELFDIYLAQRIVPDRKHWPQIPAPYSLDRMIWAFFFFKPERIFKAHRELFDLRLNPQLRGWVGQPGNLEWGLTIGLDLHRIEVLRVALDKGYVLCVKELLRLYSYKVSKQECRHLQHKIGKLGLAPEELKLTS